MIGISEAEMDLFLNLKNEGVHFDTLEQILAFNKNWIAEIEFHKVVQRTTILQDIEQQKFKLDQITNEYDAKIEARRPQKSCGLRLLKN